MRRRICSASASSYLSYYRITSTRRLQRQDSRLSVMRGFPATGPQGLSRGTFCQYTEIPKRRHGHGARHSTTHLLRWDPTSPKTKEYGTGVPAQTATFSTQETSTSPHKWCARSDFRARRSRFPLLIPRHGQRDPLRFRFESPHGIPSTIYSYCDNNILTRNTGRCYLTSVLLRIFWGRRNCLTSLRSLRQHRYG